MSEEVVVLSDDYGILKASRNRIEGNRAVLAERSLSSGRPLRAVIHMNAVSAGQWVRYQSGEARWRGSQRTKPAAVTHERFQRRLHHPGKRPSQEQSEA